ncbi:MAG: fibronectin type III domain-containing protein, partial [Verrucomicrobia bacterium]|nr:fibronectin type III domain-containing protein [Verrucomicrobiota bacterium]
MSNPIALPPRRIIAIGVIVLLLAALSSTHAALSVTLAWDPESGIAGYRLHYGTASGNYTTTSNVGNQASATVSNLTAGRT